MLMNSDSLFQQMILDLAQGKGISSLVRRLTKILNRPVLVTNCVHRIMAFHDPLGLDLKLDEFFYVPPVKVKEIHLLNRSEQALQRYQFNLEDRTIPFIYLPLLSEGYCLGYCIVLDTYRLTNSLKLSSSLEEDKVHILDAAIPLILSLRRNKEEVSRQEEYRDGFVQDILYNNYDSKAVIYERTKPWGWNLQGSLQALVVEVPAEKLEVARDLIPPLFNSSPPVSAYINRQLVLILNITGLEKSELRNSLNQFLDSYTKRISNYKKNIAVNIGVGSGVPSVIDLYKSYQEAKVALELGKVFSQKPICYFEEMGFLKFIFTQPAMELEDYCQKILGPLLDSDLTSGTELLDTLKSYLKYDCQITECAKALYIHENTLRNRIKRIEQLTAFDLRKVEHIVNLYIALQILNLGEDH